MCSGSVKIKTVSVKTFICLRSKNSGYRRCYDDACDGARIGGEARGA